MRTRRCLIALLCLAAILVCCAALGRSQPGTEGKKPEADATAELGCLLADLVRACEKPGDADPQIIRDDLRAIRARNGGDYETARIVAEHWQRVFLDPDYRLCLHSGGELAEELRYSGIPDSPTHAFVVLGYELRNGEMRPELKGRCEAAAAAARAYPKAIVVCSGGATGTNNPERHTEAGMMKAYLTEACGLDPTRILIDERAMTTAENALNTFEILRANGIRTITVVTSDYHQRWGEAVYNAAAALYRQQYGFAVDLVGSYSYETGRTTDLNGARIASRQIAEILGIPPDAQHSPREEQS